MSHNNIILVDWVKLHLHRKVTLEWSDTNAIWSSIFTFHTHMLKRALLFNLLHYMNLDVCELIFTIYFRMQNTGAVQNVYYAKLKDISY